MNSRFSERSSVRNEEDAITISGEKERERKTIHVKEEKGGIYGRG